jgi:hypothetical protein
VAQLLRGAELPGAELDLAGRSIKGQLKQATRLGARLAVFVGLGELGEGRVRVRHLADGAERDCQVAHLPAVVEQLLSGTMASAARDVAAADDGEPGADDERGPAGGHGERGPAGGHDERPGSSRGRPGEAD